MPPAIDRPSTSGVRRSHRALRLVLAMLLAFGSMIAAQRPAAAEPEAF